MTTGEESACDDCLVGVEPLAKDQALESMEDSMNSMKLVDGSVVVDEQQANSLQNSVIELTDKMASEFSDVDYVPPICVRAATALQDVIDRLPIIGLGESVLDIHDRGDAPGHEQDVPDNPEQLPASDMPTFPGPETVISEDDLVDQPAWITYKICLMQLATFLQLPIKKCYYIDHNTGLECNGVPPFQVKLHSRGTAAVVEWLCSHGHNLWKWNSQPVLKYGMQGGDFMLSTNILLSGNNFSKVALLFRFMHMGMVAPSTFYAVQDTYCVDAIKQFWEHKRVMVIDRLRTKDSVVALADGRMDSPGHSAQYCTYTTMEHDSKDIISVVTVDKRLTNLNSVVMEKHAFIQTFDKLLGELNITEIVTDAHMQIASLMNPEKGRYKGRGIIHSLDIWHAAKNLTKKLHAAGMVSGQSAILVWMKDIVNHFWFCCQMADNREEFMGMWRGVLHHVCGVHEWALGKCQHQPLDAVSSAKDCMLSRSAAHEALSQIVLNRRWLKDVEKFLTFRSTSELESFQNHLLMYVSKRFAFAPPIYEARTLLAALDYNHHNHRPVHINPRGEVSQKRIYSKKSKRYRVHTVKVAKDYSYIPQLQRKILGERLKSSGGVPRRRILRQDDPRSLGLLTGVVPPPTAELAQAQISRGQDMTSTT